MRPRDLDRFDGKTMQNIYFVLGALIVRGRQRSQKMTPLAEWGRAMGCAETLCSIVAFPRVPRKQENRGSGYGCFLRGS